jgi:hypothetical protein
VAYCKVSAFACNKCRNPQRSSVTTAGFPAQIRNRQFPDISLELHLVLKVQVLLQFVGTSIASFH